jgi:hypothetical protein
MTNFKTNLFTAGFLGLVGLFGTSEALADQPQPLRIGPSGGVRVEVNTKAGSIVLASGRPGYENYRTREVIERVWVPARYEDRRTQVLVSPAHYEERRVRVLVQPAHYEERQVNVLVEAGHWHTQWVPPVYRTMVDRHGCKVQVLVRDGYNERTWCPDRYETRFQKILVPDRFEERCEQVLVPAQYEERCEKVYVAGYWKEERRVVRDDRRFDGIVLNARDW